MTKSEGKRSRSINSNISKKITSTLRTHAEKTLFSDEFGSWTGSAAFSRMKEIESYILNMSQPGQRVGIVMQNSAAKAMSILATMRIGRVPVIFSANEGYEFLSKQTSLSCLISDAYIENNFRLPFPVVQLNQSAHILFEYTTQSKNTSACPSGTGLCLFTSGSSGNPKGVLVPEEGLIYSVDYLIQYFGLSSATKATVFLPTSHSMGLNTQFFPTFFAGGESQMINTSKSLSRMYRTLLASKGTFVGLIGDMLKICFEEKRRRKLPPADSVKHVQLAGGIIHQDHLKVARELFPHATLHKGYGMTEATRVAMINSNDPAFMNDTAGYVWPGQRVEIRGNKGQVLPTGTAGEIFIQGPNVTLGYDFPKATQVDRGDFFASGDIGRFDKEGRLSILGRKDSIFKINGERVSAKDIEKLALEANFCIRDVKCLPLEGPKIARVKAVLFLEIPPEMQGDFESEGRGIMEAKLKLRLNSQKYLPREILILDKFPRTPSGKLKAARLKEMYEEQISDAKSLGSSSVGVSFKRLEAPPAQA